MLNEVIGSMDGWITTQSVNPDVYEMIYDFEWPKNADHLSKLFALKSFDLQEIVTHFNDVDEKPYVTGIQFMFYGEKEPITYG